MTETLKPSRFDVMTVLSKIGKGPLFYGIEIELEFLTEQQRVEFIIEFNSRITHSLLKIENTIVCGVEIVTSPLSIECVPAIVEELVSLCKKHNGLTSSRTGIHVHVSKTSNEGIQIFQFLNNPVHREELISFSGRLSEYARFTTRSYPHNKGKGYCVNLKPKDTIEFRMFQTILDVEWILGCVYFCEMVKTHITEIRTFEDLISISKTKYPSYLTERLLRTTKTPKGKRYPIAYPVPELIQFW
jgi:hypothetical protein